MITAVDTNVLLDLLTADPVHGDASRRALLQALSSGSVVICEVVYAELAAAFTSSRDDLDRFVADAGLRLQRTPEAALAGHLWRASIATGAVRANGFSPTSWSPRMRAP